MVLQFKTAHAEDFFLGLKLEELSKEELFSLLKKAYRSFHLRPSYIFKRTLELKSGKELFRKAKSALNIFKI